MRQNLVPTNPPRCLGTIILSVASKNTRSNLHPGDWYMRTLRLEWEPPSPFICRDTRRYEGELDH